MDQKGMEFTVFDTYLNLQKRLSSHNCICVSVSGGADSDVIVHLIATQFKEHLHKIHFVFSNTGLEYQATLRHIDYLEKKYSIRIDRIHGTPIPVVVKKYGVPFISKRVSDYMHRLQINNFDWSSPNYDSLIRRFPKCLTALKWWCNAWGESSRFNISRNKFLQEFLLSEKPKIKFSYQCCQKSKKDPMKKYQKSIGCDLYITGERKGEGGSRAAKKACFETVDGLDHYMPLFHWDNDTKKMFVKAEGIVHSDCYTVYGLPRTGCAGCPYALHWREELETMQKYEPKLYKACMHVFGESYRLTDAYYDYRRKQSDYQITMDDLLKEQEE